MSNYDKARHFFDSHVCSIRDQTESVKELTPFQKYMIANQDKSPCEKEEQIERFKKAVFHLIKNKIDHTNRGIQDIEELFKIFPGLSDDYIDLAKTAELFHDIGRFLQAYDTVTHVDGDSYNVELHQKRKIEYPVAQSGISDHGRHGAYLLYDMGNSKKTGIPSTLFEVIYNVVKYHTNGKGLPFQIERLDDSLFHDLSVKSVANHPTMRNKFMTLYYQAVKAVDDFDLHNKLLNGEVPLVRDTFGLDVQEGDTVATIATRWGISEQQLRDSNNMGSKDEFAAGDIVRIRSSDVPTERFKIKEDYADMYFRDTLGTDLGKLQGRSDYTFLNAQLFRLSTLRNISFSPLLQHILTTQMLERTLDSYPERYKLIMKPYFEFAKSETEKRIQQSKSKIYVPRTIPIKKETIIFPSD